MSSTELTGLRTLVVGLDGCCLSVLQPMFDAGELPTLAALADRAAVDTLQSQLPPWTPSAWPSLYTGKNPGKHGVYDFLHFDGYDWDVVNRSHVKAHAVWELLSMSGFESVVVNVPVTHPPPAFSGALVPGYIAPEEPTCHPESVWDELTETLGSYRLYGSKSKTESTRDERIETYEHLIEKRGAAFRYLVETRDPEFGFLEFQQCDTVFHEYPGDSDAVSRVYQAIDTQLSAVIETCSPDITILVSDHGIGPLEGYEFRVNEFLRANDFAQSTAGEGGMPSWKMLANGAEQPAGSEEDETTPSAATRLLQSAAAVGVTSQRIETVLTRLGLRSLVLNVIPRELIRAGTERIDFANSTAYMRSRTEMGIRLNVVGREPDGVVDPDSYTSVRTQIIERLRAVETPDGEPIFEQVVPREAVFEGPYLSDAPDILTVPTAFDHYLSATVRDERFGEPTEPWEHKREGVVMIAGDGVDSAADLQGSHLFDISPTILATFGLGVGGDMDGTVLSAVESVGRTEYPPFDPESAVTTNDEAVEQRLADLGYLE